MKIFDLSHTLDDKIPVYPGTPLPVIKKYATIAKDGFNETHFCLTSHTGTHIDAPYHMIERGEKLDHMPLNTFTGKALVINVPGKEHFIQKEMILNAGNTLKNVDFLLFYTGWSKFWGSREYFKDYPVLSSHALELLLSMNLKGVGFDTVSVDEMDSVDYKIHFALLRKGIIIIENLNIPNELPSKGDFFCFPLSYKDADGSPVRAVFII